MPGPRSRSSSGVVPRLDRATGTIGWLRELEIVKCVAAVGRYRRRGAWIQELDIEDGYDRSPARLGTHDQDGALTVVGYFGGSLAVGSNMLHGNGASDSFVASFDDASKAPAPCSSSAASRAA